MATDEPTNPPQDPPKTDPPQDPPKTDPPKSDPPRTDGTDLSAMMTRLDAMPETVINAITEKFPHLVNPPKTDPPKTDPPPKNDPPKDDPANKVDPPQKKQGWRGGRAWFGLP